ncbi:hypothetical protein NGM10_03705 [Halorussus salilacus]|uniref:hypothetical protein n=1 Tax=Halorussus salilacus TaxID=2953750 RepID=UPI00209DF2BE|nr:hypothetical protein [Halorussus salilacus]USZ68847.1 hypothetical protein NGM10_03705 [Halorussus salilacus]
MTSVDSDLVENLAHHDDYLTARELVQYLERHHPVEGPGVPRDLVEAYAEELDYDPHRLATSLDDRTTDSPTWQPGDRVYRIEGNLSIYPASWHERLADTTDLSRFVEVMLESVAAPDGVEVERGDLGVRQDDLITAVEIIAEIGRGEAHGLLRDQRVAGDIVLYAFQNPEEVVRLPEEDSE